MKKILFSSAAALAVVVGLSSYKEAKQVTTYYFDVTASVGTGTTALLDNQVARRTDPDINPGDACTGTTKLCIVSFLTSQLTSGKLHVNSGVSHTPVAYQNRISTKD